MNHPVVYVCPDFTGTASKRSTRAAEAMALDPCMTKFSFGQKSWAKRELRRRSRYHFANLDRDEIRCLD